MSDIKEREIDLTNGPVYSNGTVDKSNKLRYEKGSLYDKPNQAVCFIEEHYPETADEFKRLQKEQYELFCRKQMDYGPSNIAMGTSLDTDEEKRLSKIGLIVRINDKIQRLINLVVRNNRQAHNEPTIDAFKDLACYGIIAQIVEAGKWGK